MNAAISHPPSADLLNGGYDIGTVQKLPGHPDAKTTMIDTHILNRGPSAVHIPADSLQARVLCGSA